MATHRDAVSNKQVKRSVQFHYGMCSVKGNGKTPAEFLRRGLFAAAAQFPRGAAVPVRQGGADEASVRSS